MTVYHKKCGTKCISSGLGDFGVCPKCNCDVHHLVIEDGVLKFSEGVVIQ